MLLRRSLFFASRCYSSSLSSDVVRRVARRARLGDWEAVVDNPGVGVYEKFVVDDNEENALREEALEIVDKYGASHVEGEKSRFFEKQMAHVGKSVVNMVRATGRPELETQAECPWGYGDDFKTENLPPGLLALGKRIQSTLKVGAMRDLTVNYRRHGFFRLDAHLDPANDGPHVCIVGLLSDTVLTLSPLGPPLSTICDQRSVSVESWAPGRDIDVLCRQKTLLHLSGDARSKLHHGIRLGITTNQLNALFPEKKKHDLLLRDQDNNKGDENTVVPLHDWFGDPSHLVPRQPTRLSLVFAFADINSPS